MSLFSRFAVALGVLVALSSPVLPARAGECDPQWSTLNE